MQFVVVGNPIQHSFSPLLHNYAFQILGICGFYGRYCLEDKKDFACLKDLNLQGANITIPFKEIAFESCDEVFGIAQKIKAVNTIVFVGDRMLGYNTDAFGFYQCIQDLGCKNALILGAGGSAKALACILEEKQIETTILNRSMERLEFFREFKHCTFDDFTPKYSYDIVINTTPSGLTNDLLPMDRGKLVEILRDAKYAYDLVYGIDTPFFHLAKECKTFVKDGKEMLINQAILSFEIFMQSQEIPFDLDILKHSMRYIGTHL